MKKRQEENHNKRKNFLRPLDVQRIKKILRSERDVRVFRRALALSLMNKGLKAIDIEADGILSTLALRLLRKKFLSGGLKRALYDRKRCGKPKTIDQKQAQKVVALACTNEPSGASRWTLELLHEEVEKQRIISSVSKEKIRLILKSHNIKPWQQKMWCVPRLDEEYIERMEDVLTTYARPYDRNEPVICLDEKPIQLLDSKREGTSQTSDGKVKRVDYEYKRCGTANVFCVVEPKAGRHITKVTKNRKKPAFAKLICELSEKYPSAQKIHLVMDNLNTHNQSSLIETFGDKKAKTVWDRFKIHHTPKHASWLNQAEIEIGIYSRQCLGKTRVPNISELRNRTNAWNKRTNHKRLKIDWSFTVKKARQKFNYKNDRNY